MKAYGQFCPLAQAAQILCERWTLLIVRELIAGSTRFSELQKGVPLMSPTLLSTRLKQLQNAGVITLKKTGKSSVYNLTPAGVELRPIVEILGAWGHRWARTDLNEGDLDASLLMWDMRRSVDASSFPKHRVVVQFEYPDAPKGAQDWWLVSEAGEIDLCLTNPGHEIDLLIIAPLAAITAVWTCQTPLNDAIKKGDIKVLGNGQLSNKLQDWLCSSLLSKLGTSDQLPKLQW